MDSELSEAARDYPQQERDDLIETYASDFAELGDELPTILRYSVLVAADSALEAHLANTDVILGRGRQHVCV